MRVLAHLAAFWGGVLLALAGGRALRQRNHALAHLRRPLPRTTLQGGPRSRFRITIPQNTPRACLPGALHVLGARPRMRCSANCSGVQALRGVQHDRYSAGSLVRRQADHNAGLRRAAGRRRSCAGAGASSRGC